MCDHAIAALSSSYTGNVEFRRNALSGFAAAAWLWGPVWPVAYGGEC